MNNKELLEKYPFLKIKNSPVTWLDAMPDGWRKAFGEQMIEEISQALKGEELVITDIKEKFGGLRFYTGGATQEVHDIISKYERMSYHICILCGQKATKISRGWISPYCNACAKEINNNRKRVGLDKIKFIPIEDYFG
jgi:hypothetical protein